MSRKIVSLDAISANPFQARAKTDSDPIRRLADEIKAIGFWDTLRVREKDRRYELVFGHRRLEALRLLGHTELEVEVVSLDDRAMAEQTLIENLQREDLPEIDKALAIRRLVNLEIGDGDPGITISQNTAIDRIRQLLGYSDARTIKDFLAFAALSEPTKAALRTHNTGRHVARVASAIGGETMVRLAANEQMTVACLETMQRALVPLPTEQREKIVERIINGKITDPIQVEVLAEEALKKLEARELATRIDETPPSKPQARLFPRRVPERVAGAPIEVRLNRRDPIQTIGRMVAGLHRLSVSLRSISERLPTLPNDHPDWVFMINEVIKNAEEFERRLNSADGSRLN